MNGHRAEPGRERRVSREARLPRDVHGRLIKRVPVRRGYGPVLVMIVVTYVLALLTARPWTVALLLVAQAATAWEALRRSSARPGFRLVGAAVVLLALVTAGANVIADNNRLTGLTFLAAS